MSIKVTWREQCEFSVSTEDGFQLHIDADGKKAPCPTEILLSALGSCSATDMVMALQEQGADIQSLTNELSYTLTESSPRLYESVNLHFVVKATAVTANQIIKAADNALNKYCHVCLILQPKIKISYTYEII